MKHKAVMLSIKPEYCHLIAKGEKIIEVRKSKPKQVDVPFKCYVYCTSKDLHLGLLTGQGSTDLIVCSNWKTAIPVGGEIANGKVIGEFVCDEIYSYGEDTPYGKYYMSESELADCCISSIELEKYADGKDLYGWHISDLKIYDTPKELSEFTKYTRSDCEFAHVPFVRPDNCNPCVGCKLEKPPQSWCYVEEVTA